MKTPIAAVLFDLDGTLANTEQIHFQTWQELLLDFDLEIDKAFYQSRISGGITEKIVTDILPQLSPEEAILLAQEKETRFRKLAEKLQRIAGVDEVLSWVQERGLKQALVTNAPVKNVHFMLGVLELAQTFEIVILAEDEPAGKPDPLPYRVALERLGVSPEEAIAFEDSPSGIRSAVGAGIYTIAVASSHDPQEQRHLGASMTIDDFTDAELWKLLRQI